MGLNEDLGDRENVGNASLSFANVRTAKWTRIRDRFPSVGGMYQIRLPSGEEHEAWFVERKSIFVSPDGAVGYDPTHWKTSSS